MNEVEVSGKKLSLLCKVLHKSASVVDDPWKDSLAASRVKVVGPLGAHPPMLAVRSMGRW